VRGAVILATRHELAERLAEPLHAPPHQRRRPRPIARRIIERRARGGRVLTTAPHPAHELAARRELFERSAVALRRHVFAHARHRMPGTVRRRACVDLRSSIRRARKIGHEVAGITAGAGVTDPERPTSTSAPTADSAGAGREKEREHESTEENESSFHGGAAYAHPAPRERSAEIKNPACASGIYAANGTRTA